MIVKSNYFLLYLMNKNLDKILKFINEDEDLEEEFTNLYNEKSKIFNLQVKKWKIKQPYNFTGIEDLFYDNMFFYYGQVIDRSKINTFKRHFIYREKNSKKEEDKKDDKNKFSEYQQKNFELELDNYLTKDQVKEKQEEALVKYYKFLDKENYEKINTLGKLGQWKEIKNQK